MELATVTLLIKAVKLLHQNKQKIDAPTTSHEIPIFLEIFSCK